MKGQPPLPVSHAGHSGIVGDEHDGRLFEAKVTHAGAGVMTTTPRAKRNDAAVSKLGAAEVAPQCLAPQRSKGMMVSRRADD